MTKVSIKLPKGVVHEVEIMARMPQYSYCVNEFIDRVINLSDHSIIGHTTLVSTKQSQLIPKQEKVSCPYCKAKIDKGKLRDHLDFCEAKGEKKAEKKPRKIIMDVQEVETK